MRNDNNNLMSGMIRGLKEFFKDYKGCRNCKYQPEPLQMCEWGKKQTRVELICSKWERRKYGNAVRVRKRAEDRA